jgi:hypothetical protein
MVAILPRLSGASALIATCWCLAAPIQAAVPLFDAHLHYDAEDAVHFTPTTIITQLKANGVIAAAVTSRPPEQVLQLHAQAPGLVVPMLGVYCTAADKAAWVDDPSLPERVAQALGSGPWRAVGELHLFAAER